MPRQKDAIWEYFSEIVVNGAIRAKCKMCGDDIASLVAVYHSFYLPLLKKFEFCCYISYYLFFQFFRKKTKKNLFFFRKKNMFFCLIGKKRLKQHP